MMHQDSLEPSAIRFTLERLQESADIVENWWQTFLSLAIFALPIQSSCCKVIIKLVLGQSIF